MMNSTNQLSEKAYKWISKPTWITSHKNVMYEIIAATKREWQQIHLYDKQTPSAEEES